MEKEGFNDLVQHYTSSQPDEAKEIIQLRDNYPYSQVIQVLAARFGKDHRWDNQQTLLQSAAVYSTDRTVLKDLMTTAYTERVRLARKDKPVIKHDDPVITKTIEGVDFADEIMRDLKQLRESKSSFEHLLTELDLQTAATPVPEEEPPAKPKRGPGRPRKKKPEEGSDPIINEIKTTKKKITPSNSKAKEQIDIIDKFIKAQPNITPKTPASEAENQDLTSAGTDFGDHVVSETLVEILLRQGKKEKAIEVLKKLIWKFPQKKAYFAAQIEELKK